MRVSSVLNEVFDDLLDIERMCVEGMTEREVAETLKWRMEDVRRAAKVMGLSLSPMAAKPVFCPKCGHWREWISDKTGHCSVCSKQYRAEKLAAVYAEEERRLDEAMDREINTIKQRGQRMRDERDANPRKKSLSAWIEHLASEPPQALEEVVSQVEECRLALALQQEAQ